MNASSNSSARSRVSRRAILRGAGVAITLPWLESLTRAAGAQAALPSVRFVAIFLPNGAPDLWKPPAAGLGANWQLSSPLEPLAALKSKLSVVSGLETGSVFNPDGSSSVEPSHGKQSGAWLTCSDAAAIRQKLQVPDANGVSVDQIIAAHAALPGKTAFDSLQLGLSTMQSFCENSPCSLSRSVSWKTETTPLYKSVDPLEVFNRLVGAAPTPGSPTAAERQAARKSVLDAVQETTAAARAQLSATDKPRLDEFLDAVRSVEMNLTTPAGDACGTLTKPNFPTVTPSSYPQNTATYTKAAHADLMNELLALALQCNQTRIVSYMLEDERSEFLYDFVPKRQFSALTSTEGTGTCGQWHLAMHDSPDEFASIVHWHVGKVAALCQRLDGMLEENGKSVLDNSVIFLGAGTHGSNHAAADLPSLLVGSGGGILKTDQHLALGNRPLRDLYFTLMNGVYDLGVTDFGVNRSGAPIALIEQLLA